LIDNDVQLEIPFLLDVKQSAEVILKRRFRDLTCLEDGMLTADSPRMAWR
jgi:hypothetical protein